MVGSFSQEVTPYSKFIIISQTATPLVKANSYKPEGTSSEGSPVRKRKKTENRINNNKYISALYNITIM